MKKIMRMMFFVLPFITGMAIAQKTSIYSEPSATYREAIELLNKEKYGAALKSFTDVKDAITDDQSVMKVNSEYYAALCGLELFHNDAEYSMTEFIKKHPDNVNIIRAYFMLGKFQYRKKEWNKAIESFKNVEVYDLSEAENAEYNFKAGYSYFMLKQNDQAKKHFFEIIEKDTKYTAPANYYYGHIAYTEKNYETALKSFDKILKDENFSAVVPYYIAQIYYLLQRYDELLKVAPPLLDSANTKRAPEIARIIGEAYFKTNRFAEATKYLEMYKQKTNDALTDEDYYQLGFAYYKSGDYLKAVINFQNVDQKNDTLAQLTQYTLADCYLKQGKKQFAMNSFNAAYKLTFDKDIQEDALFNYAKLTYDLALNPYNEAINALQKYITQYPNSTKVDEANTYLINLFMTTKNYKDALESIEKLKVKDPKMLEAYQKIAYFRGVQLFNDKKLTEAIAHFDKSLTYSEEKKYTALAYYWSAEAYYRLEKYEKAKESYQTFLGSPGAFSMPEYNMTQYNLAYVSFKQKDYSKANIYFRKFISGKTNEKESIVSDAYLRAGDCYFIDHNYTSALEYYDKAIDLKVTDVDYAMYQKSLALGVIGKFNTKITTLNDMITAYPKSQYVNDALFEIANTYFIALEDNKNALVYFKRVVDEFPNKDNSKRAMLNIGKIQENTDNDADALTTYKNIATNYQGTPQSEEALKRILNIYVSMDKVAEFYEWVKNKNLHYDVKDSEIDSSTYTAAENRYFAGDCEQSGPGFKNYIEKFKAGQYIINANFYKAECDYKSNNLSDALKEYDFVVTSPVSKFTEKALLNAAAISYKLGNYPKATEYYTKLDNNAEYPDNVMTARTGIMRCNYLMTRYPESVKSARLLLTTEKIPEELVQEAHITIARSALAMDSIALAQTEFEITAKLSKTELGAEAKYNLADIQYKLGNYKEAEKAVFEVINQVPSYDYWIAKSFILLSDVYVKTNNIAQAKATLQSIIENYDGADLLQVAHEKLNAISATEKIQEQKKAQEDIEIKFGSAESNDKKLNNE
jgi:TolA-binding protein